jgi:predicted RNase H-like nuclease (RuvC/YqgF family)
MTDDRDNYIAHLREQLEEWNMGLDELQSRVDRAEAETNDEAQARRTRVEALRREYDEAYRRFSNFRSNDTDTWDNFREGMEEARKLLDEGLEEARRGLDR